MLSTLTGFRTFCRAFLLARRPAYFHAAAFIAISVVALSAGLVLAGQERYDYDPIGRLIRYTDSSNQVTDYTYDDNGNLTQKQNTQDAGDKTIYSWDARNRLIGLTQPNVQASFSYDSGGRRIAKAITANGTASTVQYIYEGAQVIGEVRNGALDASLITAGLDDAISRILSAISAGTLRFRLAPGSSWN